MADENNVFSLDNALSLMNSAPATAPTADWQPDREAKPQELPPEPKAEEKADDAAPDTKTDTSAAADDKDTPATDDQGETKDGDGDPEAALPPIEAPSSWKAEEKEVFKSLPRAAQEAIQRREQDRTTELRNLQNAQAEQRKQLDGEVARLKGLASQIETAANERLADLAREFPDLKTPADVEALAQRDPARFSLFQAKLMRFNEANMARAEAQKELQAKAETANREAMLKARDALLDAFPTWKTPEGQKEMTEIQDYAIKLGVPEQAARSTLDPFVYKLAQKAMLYDRAQAAKTEAVVKTPPKVIKPGTSTTKGEQNADRRQAQMRKLEKSGDLEDALGLLRA